MFILVPHLSFRGLILTPLWRYQDSCHSVGYCHICAAPAQWRLGLFFSFLYNWKSLTRSSLFACHLSPWAILGPLSDGFQIFGKMFWCQQLTISLLGDALLVCIHFLFGWKVIVMWFPLVPHLSLEIPFWLRCGRFEILGLVVATVTFRTAVSRWPLLYCLLLFPFWFESVWNYFSWYPIHLQRGFIWLCCDVFEIFGLVVATVTFALPSLGDALNVCFCFHSVGKSLWWALFWYPVYLWRYSFGCAVTVLRFLGSFVANVTLALPSLGGALVFCFCFLSWHDKCLVNASFILI